MIEKLVIIRNEMKKKKTHFNTKINCFRIVEGYTKGANFKIRC